MKDVKKIGFLGFGKSNKSLLEYLSKNFSFDAVIRDERKYVDAPKGAELLLGDKCFLPNGEDVIFLSPSVRRERECVSQLKKSGSLLSSDAELFFSSGCENVFAITGSDGKSTTSALVGEILKSDGKQCFVCGNFGLPMAPLSDRRDAYFVTELSSFMLRYTKPTSKRALITCITPNHLNWHTDFDEYKSAKENLLINAKERVFSFDCPESQNLIDKYGAFAVFSVNTPYKELSLKIKADIYATFENGFITINGETLAARSDIPLVGIHNIKNVLAALCMTLGFCGIDSALNAICSFRGLAHRCKLVSELGGLKYYDSSIDSTPERTRVTLASFNEPVTVILGGQDKNLSYAPLSDALTAHAGAVILCGDNAEKIKNFLQKKKIPCPLFIAKDYPSAVRISQELGLDTVLSPASTSYDCFNNFEERGDVFLQAIKEYKNLP